MKGSVNYEVVNDLKHIFALLAAVVGIDLRDGELSFSVMIIITCNDFDGNFEASHLVLGIVNSILAGLVHLPNYLVLLKMGIQTLCFKDGVNERLSFLFRAKENFMHTSSIADRFELGNV